MWDLTVHAEMLEKYNQTHSMSELLSLDMTDTSFIPFHAEAEAAYLQGQGIARQRQAIVNGLRESVLNFEDGVKAVSPQEVIELMMVISLWSLPVLVL